MMLTESGDDGSSEPSSSKCIQPEASTEKNPETNGEIPDGFNALEILACVVSSYDPRLLRKKKSKASLNDIFYQKTDNNTSEQHRVSCHRCGNIRKRKLYCPRAPCPHIFCGRCAEKMKDDYGPDAFVGGCPVCREQCCCSNKSLFCDRKNHCYRKCPATKLRNGDDKMGDRDYYYEGNLSTHNSSNQLAPMNGSNASSYDNIQHAVSTAATTDDSENNNMNHHPNTSSSSSTSMNPNLLDPSNPMNNLYPSASSANNNNPLNNANLLSSLYSLSYPYMVPPHVLLSMNPNLLGFNPNALSNTGNNSMMSSNGAGTGTVQAEGDTNKGMKASQDTNDLNSSTVDLSVFSNGYGKLPNGYTANNIPLSLQHALLNPLDMNNSMLPYGYYTSSDNTNAVKSGYTTNDKNDSNVNAIIDTCKSITNNPENISFSSNNIQTKNIESNSTSLPVNVLSINKSKDRDGLDIDVGSTHMSLSIDIDRSSIPDENGYTTSTTSTHSPPRTTGSNTPKQNASTPVHGSSINKQSFATSLSESEKQVIDSPSSRVSISNNNTMNPMMNIPSNYLNEAPSLMSASYDNYHNPMLHSQSLLLPYQSAQLQQQYLQQQQQQLNTQNTSKKGSSTSKTSMNDITATATSTTMNGIQNNTNNLTTNPLNGLSSYDQASAYASAAAAAALSFNPYLYSTHPYLSMDMNNYMNVAAAAANGYNMPNMNTLNALNNMNVLHGNNAAIYEMNTTPNNKKRKKTYQESINSNNNNNNNANKLLSTLPMNTSNTTASNNNINSNMSINNMNGMNGSATQLNNMFMYPFYPTSSTDSYMSNPSLYAPYSYPSSYNPYFATPNNMNFPLNVTSNMPTGLNGQYNMTLNNPNISNNTPKSGTNTPGDITTNARNKQNNVMLPDMLSMNTINYNALSSTMPHLFTTTTTAGNTNNNTATTMMNNLYPPGGQAMLTEEYLKNRIDMNASVSSTIPTSLSEPTVVLGGSTLPVQVHVPSTSAEALAAGVPSTSTTVSTGS